jgi:hypothetical protein
MDYDFENAMCQEASDMFGTGKLNAAFKLGAEWAYERIFPMSEKWRKQFGASLDHRDKLHDLHKQALNTIKKQSQLLTDKDEYLKKLISEIEYLQRNVSFPDLTSLKLTAQDAKDVRLEE